MSNRTKVFGALACVAVASSSALAVSVAHDLNEGSALLADVNQEMQARYATQVDLPALRSPAEDCDGLQRQLDLFEKVAPQNLSQELQSPAFRPGLLPVPPTLHSFLADHENGFDRMLDATRCTSTKLERLEIGREVRPAFAIVKTMLWRADVQSMPRLEPAACVTWCNEVLRSSLDDMPGNGSVSGWQSRIVPMIEGRMSECALDVDKVSANVAAQNLAKLIDAWTPFSTQVRGETLETAASLSFYYEAGGETKWPFHGPRAHLQFRRVLANDHALLDHPERWKGLDSGSFQARSSALHAELTARDVRPVPFGESVVVSPGWDIAVGSSNGIEETLEENLSAYLKVQAAVRMAYAALIAPDGSLSAHQNDPLVRDPFGDPAVFLWDATKKSYYSVGPNGKDDGGSGDDVVSQSI